ncbi:hypothetical protein [Olivibacter sp. XZL3]|uniref:hypothetical protein n=1 Tax=Olivibacter sp. XZL3 TaxID=1735116 RepID=UPI001065AD20|nr:hypothetical protein [Olivibacter sp. XZL3]
MESEIIKQKEEITYLKTTLKLLSASIEAEAEEISFKINGVRGNINQQKIFVEGIIENKGAKRAIQAADANLFDPQGNSHKAYQITFGDETRLELQPDIPVKFKIEFTDIREQPPVIKAIVLKVYRRAMPGRTEDVIFKNLAVHWK